MDDRARPVRAEQRVDQRAIADVAADEDVAGVAFEARQVGEIAGVGEGVEVDDALLRGLGGGEPVEDEVAADEAGAAGDEDGHQLRP